MTLGELIKKYRTDHDMSMDAFSQKTGLSKSYVSMLERNKDPRGNEITPSIETIYKVSKGVNMSFDEVFRVLDQNQLVRLNGSFDENLEIILKDFDKVLGLSGYKGLPPDKALNYIRTQIPLLSRAIRAANISASTLTDDEAELLSMYRTLSQERKEDLIKFATMFSKEV